MQMVDRSLIAQMLSNIIVTNKLIQNLLANLAIP